MANSGHEIGQKYVEALQQYIDALRCENQSLPARCGKVSTSAVALAAGIDRQSLYKNPGCRALLEAAAQELGIKGITAPEAKSPKDDVKDRRIQTLEAQNASLRAEVEGLRQRLRRYAHIEQHMVETGRRVIL